MTEDGKLKIVILTHGGADRVLELLSENDAVEIASVFLETPVEPTRTLTQKISRSIRYDGYGATAKKLLAKFIGQKSDGAYELQTLAQRQDTLKTVAASLQIPVIEVNNFHDESSVDLIKQQDADLGILYGTNIIKETVFSIPRLGSINIHQGLAPIYRGGPPVFWELFNGEKEVGITVHFVAAKVDTGDILLQETLPLDYDVARYGWNYEHFIEDFRLSMIEPSAQIIVKAVDQIATAKASPVKQDTTLGKRYRLPVRSEKDQLRRRLKDRFSGGK